MLKRFETSLIKQIMIISFCILLSLIMTSCQKANSESVNENEEYMGYITEINSKTLLLDDFEFITPKNEKRVKELGLTQNDMPNNYYIHNYSDDILSFKLTRKTEFTFYDMDNLFIVDSNHKKYTTSDVDEFREFLYSKSSRPRKFPFKVEVKRGKVVSIVEEVIN